MSNNTSNSKVININSASIVDLKAELFRKKEEVRQKKNLYDLDLKAHPSASTPNADNSSKVDKNNDEYLYSKNLHNLSKLPKKITDVVSKSNDKKHHAKRKEHVSELKTDDDENARREEDLALKKSKEKLEKKALLYEQMSSGSVIVDQENSDDLLVNFEQKKFMQIDLAKENDQENSEDEVVEYEDEFGRTKRISKKELEIINIEKDKKASQIYTNDNWSLNNDLLSEDMKREIERREWEEETYNEIKDKSSSTKNIYYNDVREGEIRDHGVAFYSFSGDEETRTRQMEMLEKLRNETESKKSEKQKVKERRKQMLRERLSKVAARKGIQLPQDDDNDTDSEPELEQVRIHKSSVDRNVGPKIVKLREWDIGKEGVNSAESQAKTPFYDQQKYIEIQREERNKEFAPPSIYYESSVKTNNFKKVKVNNLRQNSDIPHCNESNNIDMKSLIANKISEIRKGSNK